MSPFWSVPELKDWAYHPIPKGMELPGRPSEYSIALLSSTKSYRLETAAEREAARRILRLQVSYRRWVAVSVKCLLEALREQEPEVPVDGDLEFKEPHVDQLVRTGIEMLVSSGLLGTRKTEDDDSIIWPTQQLLDLLVPYRPAPTPAA